LVNGGSKSVTPDQRNTFVGIAILVGGLILCVFFTKLCTSTDGEIAAALGSVVGGIIGALGAAVAVYLTITGQQKDETEKICTAITIEIAQLARFPLGQLELCHAIYQRKETTIPKAHLPLIMQTPSPTLYLAAAERISRVHRPVLVTAFYVGLVETEKCVNIITNGPPSSPFLTPIDVQGLGIILINQCTLAREILDQAPPIPTGKEELLVAQMISETVRSLDEQLLASRDVFPTTAQWEEATAI